MPGCWHRVLLLLCFAKVWLLPVQEAHPKPRRVRLLLRGLLGCLLHLPPGQRDYHRRCRGDCAAGDLGVLLLVLLLPQEQEQQVAARHGQHGGRAEAAPGAFGRAAGRAQGPHGRHTAQVRSRAGRDALHPLRPLISGRCPQRGKAKRSPPLCASATVAPSPDSSTETRNAAAPRGRRDDWGCPRWPSSLSCPHVRVKQRMRNGKARWTAPFYWKARNMLATRIGSVTYSFCTTFKAKRNHF